MKTLLVLACLVLTGCATFDLQNTLSKALPPDFKGDAHVSHENPYFDLTIDVGNARKVDDRWVFDWLTYKRRGRFSTGVITLGGPPKPDAK